MTTPTHISPHISPLAGLTLNSTRRFIRGQLADADKPDADGEAREIVLRVTGLTPTDLITRGTEFVPTEHMAAIMEVVERRLAGEPLDNIIGERVFYGRAFRVTPDVLSPREDTEPLITRALAMLDGVTAPRLLDLGTGSGAIAITLLAERPDASALAVDLSPQALLVAEENATTHGVADRFDLAQGSWFDSVQGRFDLIISNPPYITDAAMRDLATEVADYDPALSLAGGPDGLDAYRVIVAEAQTHLQPGAPLLLEIGYDQGPAVADLLRVAGFTDVAVSPDLAGHDRVVEGLAPEMPH